MLLYPCLSMYLLMALLMALWMCCAAHVQRDERDDGVSAFEDEVRRVTPGDDEPRETTPVYGYYFIPFISP